MARGLTPHVIKICRQELEKSGNKDLKQMVDILEGFDGSMDLESVQATVYSYWQYFFYANLMSEFTNEGLTGSQLLSDG